MAETAASLGLDAALLRRNLVTHGVDLEALIGVRFRLGEAVLVGVRRCEPCRYIERFTRAGLLRELGERGGLRVHIVTGGRVRVGERITVLADGPEAASAGAAATS
jgi:MOSC domain-containing protein YiiM